VWLAQYLIVVALGIPTKTPRCPLLPVWGVIGGLSFGYTPNHPPGRPDLGPGHTLKRLKPLLPTTPRPPLSAAEAPAHRTVDPVRLFIPATSTQ
jgi:hypothetical protein